MHGRNFSASYITVVAERFVASRKQSLRSAAAAGQMQALTDDASGGFISPLDEAEIQTEAMAVGLVAADRLASLLLYNAEAGPRQGLKVGPSNFYFCHEGILVLGRLPRRQLGDSYVLHQCLRDTANPEPCLYNFNSTQNVSVQQTMKEVQHPS